jgi:hypothetical protein
MPVELDTVMLKNPLVPVPVGVTVLGLLIVQVGAELRPLPALVTTTVVMFPLTTVGVAATVLPPEKVRVIPEL